MHTLGYLSAMFITIGLVLYAKEIKLDYSYILCTLSSFRVRGRRKGEGDGERVRHAYAHKLLAMAMVMAAGCARVCAAGVCVHGVHRSN